MLSKALKRIAQELEETGFVDNIEQLSEEGTAFRKVIYTSNRLQLVTMSLKPKEEIGAEVHPATDQFIRVEKGIGKSVLNGVEHDLTAGFSVIVPAGVKHNIINTSNTADLKLYTLYSPPHHSIDKVHQTKADALADKNDFLPKEL